MGLLSRHGSQSVLMVLWNRSTCLGRQDRAHTTVGNGHSAGEVAELLGLVINNFGHCDSPFAWKLPDLCF